MTENPGRGWQARLRRAPLLVVGLTTAVLWSIIMLGIEALQGRDLEAADFAAVGAGALFVAVFTVGFGRWREAKDRKLPPGPATARNLNRAIATGRLPEQAIAEEWVSGLKKIIRQDRRMIWVVLLELGLFIALGIYVIFDRPDHPWFGVVCTALFIGVLVYLPFGARRRRARIEELIARLSRNESSER